MHMVRQVWGKQQPSVLIVGSGLTGAILSVLLRESGAQISLLEQVIPPGRAHGFHGVSDSWDWRTLGIEPPVDATPIASVEHRFGALSTSTVSHTVDGWRSIEHRALLKHLVGTAVDAGVRFVRDATVTALIPSASGYSGVRTEDGRVFSTDIIVFADESDPRVPELLGLRPDWPPTDLMHLGKVRYDVSEKVIQSLFGHGDSGLSVTASSGKASWGSEWWLTVVPGQESFTVTVAMLLEDEMAHARHIREVIDELELVDPLLPFVKDFTPSAFFTEVVPLGGFRERPTLSTSNVMVISDLAGLTHPLNRDGFSGNFSLCTVAADTIKDAFAASSISVGLESFTKQVNNLVISPVAHARRASLQRRRQPEWQWASKPELVEPVTNDPKSANLTPQRLWNRVRRT